MNRYLEIAKEQRRLRASQGICTTCGKRPALSGYLQCAVCKEYKRSRYEEKAAERPETSLKYSCIWTRLKEEFGEDARI